MTIGKIIEKYCLEHAMSFSQFAVKCDMTKSYVSMLVNGGINPSTGKPLRVSIKTYNKIANGIGIPLNDLLAAIDDDDIEVPKEALSVPKIPPEDRAEVAFALMGEVRDLTPNEMRDVMDFVQFVKAKRNNR